MNDILFQILADKRQEVAYRKKSVPQRELCELIQQDPKTSVSMRAALKYSSSGIIAEFKRKSPSKGWIKETACIDTVVPAYTDNGASALSVLTDSRYFGGSLDDLRAARAITRLPLLRKDFIIDSYQLLEAKHAGADAVLLIATALPESLCKELAAEAQELGMETLLEIHSEKELRHLSPDIDMLGVNNRHLGTFRTDINLSFSIAEKLPSDLLLVSESGISGADQIHRLRQSGFRGFLMGECFMKEKDPGMTLNRLIKHLTR